MKAILDKVKLETVKKELIVKISRKSKTIKKEDQSPYGNKQNRSSIAKYFKKGQKNRETHPKMYCNPMF